VAGARRPSAAQSTRLPHTPTSAALARQFVAATLYRWGLDTLVEVVALLAGELVTNAIMHTSSTTVGLVVCLDDQVLRVEVHDASPQRPRLDGRAARDDPGGRGLELVAALANRWGVDIDPGRHADGKAVWFEVQASAG
jgi:anti-sigma regulatory factor (Ser/Thr protein kinase)